ncbi:hypothetical protein J6590_034961 [Homalodisca vitripennis]|nr:hypothetical protein J6590_034961 [Homalodisca vitripennis]
MRRPSFMPDFIQEKGSTSISFRDFRAVAGTMEERATYDTTLLSLKTVTGIRIGSNFKGIHLSITHETKFRAALPSPPMKTDVMSYDRSKVPSIHVLLEMPGTIMSYISLL